VISTPAATTYSPAPPPPAAGAAGRQGYPAQVAYGGSAGAYPPSAPAAQPRRPDAGANAGGTQVSYGPPRVQQAPPPQIAVAQPADNSQSLRILEGKLKTIQLILAANLALVALLLAWVFMQGQELAQTHKDLQALRVQAQSAVGQLTPSLDARLSVFEKRMDAMDAKVNAAQDRMVKGMDAQAKLAEDRLVERMNVEIPAMLDKYVAKKMAEVKH